MTKDLITVLVSRTKEEKLKIAKQAGILNESNELVENYINREDLSRANEDLWSEFINKDN